VASNILPQGPMVRCDLVAQHEPHSMRLESVVPNAYCNGVPTLDPFIELAIRVDLELWGGTAGGRTHQEVLDFFAQHGLGLIVDAIGSEKAASVLRVRTGEGHDQVYPIVGKRGNELRVVIDAPQKPYFARCPTCDSPEPRKHPAMQFEGEVQPCPDLWHKE
jgi:hypothetical protein